MKVLHLFSNHKYTGPADPALDCARHLADAGLEVAFAAAADPVPGNPAGVRALARARGLDCRDELRLPKHMRPATLIGDVGRLRGLLEQERFEIVHTHLAGDHLTAVLAARGTTPVVRTIYDAALPAGWRAGFALRRTRGVFGFTPELGPALHARAGARAPQFELLSPGLDLDRFSAPRSEDPRRSWGAAPGDIVIGVVARMQTHRLFPELIDGFAQAARANPRLRLVVLGRGTNAERVAIEPARRTGLGDRIRFAGYIPPADYPGALPAFDALLYLVPGSDGTCRAAREALSSGVPVIASRRGLLPMWVRDGETGWLLEAETPQAIRAAIERAASDDGERRRLARGATDFARTHFDARRQAAAVIACYERWCGRTSG